MAYADYTFYTEVYLGNAIDEESFQRLAERASEYISGATQGRSDNVSGERLRAVKKAMCAIAEVLQDEYRMSSKTFSVGKSISSETVGSHSVSYGTSSISNSEIEYLLTRKKEIMQMYLGWMFKVRSFGCTHRTR